MIEKLRAQVEEMFKNAPKTTQTVEIKEEILQNTIDRYNDLIAEGKSEQAAFNIAVAGIGDIDHLIDEIARPAGSNYSHEEIENDRKRNGILMAVSIMLYILSVVPIIVLSNTALEDTLGITLMLVMVALATGILIYRHNTRLRYSKNDDTIVEDFKEWTFKKQEDKSLVRAINSAVWSLILVAYFIISFITGAWYITWLVFPVGTAISGIIKACFDLKR